MRRFASASPTCIALPALQSSAERIALGAERQSLHDAFQRETPPLIVDCNCSKQSLGSPKRVDALSALISNAHTRAAILVAEANAWTGTPFSSPTSSTARPSSR